jgi:hypothetical protein
VLAISHIILCEDLLNEAAQLNPETPDYYAMRNFVRHLGIASGSRGAKRLEKSLETIGMLGQQFSMPQGYAPMQPEALDLNK